MLDGKLSDEERERWHWDRKLDKVKREKPRELKDIKGYDKESVLDKPKQGSCIIL